MFDPIMIEIALYILLLISIVLLVAIDGLRQWKRNKNKPVRSEHAKVTSRRIDKVQDVLAINSYDYFEVQAYYATFELQSGKQLEFQMRESQYKLLNEGDCGILRFQGTNYISFERKELGYS